MRSASTRSASIRSVSIRSASIRSASMRSASTRSASIRSASTVAKLAVSMRANSARMASSSNSMRDRRRASSIRVACHARWLSNRSVPRAFRAWDAAVRVRDTASSQSNRLARAFCNTLEPDVSAPSTAASQTSSLTAFRPPSAMSDRRSSMASLRFSNSFAVPASMASKSTSSVTSGTPLPPL